MNTLVILCKLPRVVCSFSCSNFLVYSSTPFISWLDGRAASASEVANRSLTLLLGSSILQDFYKRKKMGISFKTNCTIGHLQCVKKPRKCQLQPFQTTPCNGGMAGFCLSFSCQLPLPIFSSLLAWAPGCL